MTPQYNGRLEEESASSFGAGFTLLEMIGVLAVLGIIAALLLPKIFESIHSARVSQAAMGLNTVKTAAAQHVANFGQLPIDGSTTPASSILLDGTDARAAQFDRVLLKEQLLDSPFRARIGDGILGPNNTRVQLLPAATATAEVDGSNAAFDFDAAGQANDATGRVVLVAILSGVYLEDARALNRILDGQTGSLGENPAGHDLAGRVKYRKPQTQTSNTDKINGNGDGNGNGKGNGKGQGDVNGNGNGVNAGRQSGSSAAVQVLVYLTHH